MTPRRSHARTLECWIWRSDFSFGMILYGTREDAVAVHHITLPGPHQDEEPRTVIRDDVGTASGTPSDAAQMRTVLAAPPVEIGSVILRDPAHDPTDVLFLLSDAVRLVPDLPLRATAGRLRRRGADAPGVRTMLGLSEGSVRRGRPSRRSIRHPRARCV